MFLCNLLICILGVAEPL